MTINRSRDLTGRMAAAALGALLAFGGCGGAQKPDTKTAGESGGGDEFESGASGGGEKAGGARTDALEVAKPKAPERKITQEQKVDFDKALASYRNMRKAGPLTKAACKDIAESFEQAANDNPTLLEARFNQGQVLFECGMEAEAIRAWEMQTDGPRRYSGALSNLGFIASRKGDMMRAESMFVRAIEADPKAVSARNNLAQILRDKARKTPSPEDKRQLVGQAVQHLRAVLAVDGDNLQAYSTLAFIYYELEMFEMGKLVANQAIKRAEEIATGKYEEEREPDEKSEKGKKGKGKKAKEASADSDGQKVAKEVEGGSGEASSDSGAAAPSGYTPEMSRHIAVTYNTLGLIELKKKSVTASLGHFRRAIEMNPKFTEAHLNLGALSLNYRDYKTAEESFRAVLQQQPRNYEAVIGLGVALRGNRKIDEAEAQYHAAQKLDSSNPSSYFNLGLLYQDYKGGDKPTLQKAQQYYRDFLGKAIDGTPNQQKKEAEKRIKDIDELFVALEEMAKMQIEMEEMQRKAEAQQKEMEAKMKEMEAADKAAAEKAAAEKEAADKAAAEKAAAPAATPAAGAAPPEAAKPDAGGGKKKKGKK